MPKFGKTSRERLDGVDEKLVAVLERAIKYKDFTIITGHRGKKEQNQMVADGKSKLNWPDSKHNGKPSKAVDVAPYPIDWKDTGRFYHLAGYIQGIGEAMGIKIRFGGDWDRDGELSDNTFNDLPHLELDE